MGYGLTAPKKAGLPTQQINIGLVSLLHDCKTVSHQLYVKILSLKRLLDLYLSVHCSKVIGDVNDYF